MLKAERPKGGARGEQDKPSAARVFQRSRHFALAGVPRSLGICTLERMVMAAPRRRDPEKSWLSCWRGFALVIFDDANR